MLDNFLFKWLGKKLNGYIKVTWCNGGWGNLTYFEDYTQAEELNPSV